MNEKTLIKKGKYLSFLLRHHPEAAELVMDKHGWVSTKELLKAINLSMSELEEIVKTDNKQRFSFDKSKTKIRANQGHSININLNLPNSIPPDVLYHGTAVQFVESILKEGIKPMNRQYVHLSWDQETAVIVGKRHGKVRLLQIDTKSMVKDGCKFYLSENNVWLTNYVAPQYIQVIF